MLVRSDVFLCVLRFPSLICKSGVFLRSSLLSVVAYLRVSDICLAYDSVIVFRNSSSSDLVDRRRTQNIWRYELRSTFNLVYMESAISTVRVCNSALSDVRE